MEAPADTCRRKGAPVCFRSGGCFSKRLPLRKIWANRFSGKNFERKAVIYRRYDNPEFEWADSAAATEGGGS